MIYKTSRTLLLALSGLMATQVGFATAPFLTSDSFVIQAGGFDGKQGEQQSIGINGLIGDEFSVDHQYAKNFMGGLGYYIQGVNSDKWKLMYGVDAFYLSPTRVQGDVTQEQEFTNLSYQYSITNYPVYLAAKALIKTSDKYNITFDLGVGPNFISAHNFSETSLDEGTTVPDSPSFGNNTSVAFSATAGVGFRFNNLLGQWPLEIDYRFFYLGEGHLKKDNGQFNDELKTGNSYANALMVSTSF